MHQRTHIVSQNTLLHQNLGILSSTQSINASQNINPQQTGNIGLQQNRNLNIQQNHNLAVQQQNIMKNNLRPNTISLHNQATLTSSTIANVSTLSTLNTYQKKLHQAALMIPNVSNIPSNSLNPNFQFNFKQNDFNQDAFNQIPQKQLSSSIYNKNSDVLEFSLSNHLGKNQSQSTTNYPVFQNYETTNFSLWKDTHHSQFSVPCWGSANRGIQLHDEDTSIMENYHKWEDSSNSGNMIPQISLKTSNNYSSDSKHMKHFNTGNNFDSSKSLEVCVM